MKLTVSIDQAAALKAGIDAPNSTEKLEVNPADLTQDERDLIAHALRGGHDLTQSFPLSPYAQYYQLELIRPTIEGLRDAIALALTRQSDGLAQQAERKIKYNADARERIRQFDLSQSTTRIYLRAFRLPDGTVRYTSTSDGDITRIVPYLDRAHYYDSDLTPETKSLLDAAAVAEKRIHDDAYAAMMPEALAHLEAVEAERAKAQAIIETQNQARKAAIEQWLRECGTDNMRGRYAAGVLPEAEILDAIRDHVFGDLTAGPYTPIVRDDIVHDGDCEEPDITFTDPEVAQEVTALTWEIAQSIRAHLQPNEETGTIMLHRASCDNCTGAEQRYSLRLTRTYGPMTFHRDYAL